MHDSSSNSISFAATCVCESKTGPWDPKVDVQQLSRSMYVVLAPGTYASSVYCRTPKRLRLMGAQVKHCKQRSFELWAQISGYTFDF